MSSPLFDPTAGPVGREAPIAPRPARLDGLRIGLVENTKFNSDKLLVRLDENVWNGESRLQLDVRDARPTSAAV